MFQRPILRLPIHPRESRRWLKEFIAKCGFDNLVQHLELSSDALLDRLYEDDVADEAKWKELVDRCVKANHPHYTEDEIREVCQRRKDYEYCPECGNLTLRHIETVDQGDEIKKVLTCDDCDIIVNVFKSKLGESNVKSDRYLMLDTICRWFVIMLTVSILMLV